MSNKSSETSCLLAVAWPVMGWGWSVPMMQPALRCTYKAMQGASMSITSYFSFDE